MASGFLFFIGFVQCASSVLIDPYFQEIEDASNFQFKRDAFKRSLESLGPMVWPYPNRAMASGSNIVETRVLPPADLQMAMSSLSQNEVDVSSKDEIGKPKINQLLLERSLEASGDDDRLKLVKRVLEKKPLTDNSTGPPTAGPQFQPLPRVTHSVSKSVKIVVGVPSVSEGMVVSSTKSRPATPTQVFIVKPETTAKSPLARSTKSTRSTAKPLERTTKTPKKSTNFGQRYKNKTVKKALRRKEAQPRLPSKFRHFPVKPTEKNTFSSTRDSASSAQTFSGSPSIPPRYHETTTPTVYVRDEDPTSAMKVNDLLVADPYEVEDFGAEEDRIQQAQDYEPLVIPDPLPVPAPPRPLPSPMDKSSYGEFNYPIPSFITSFPVTDFKKVTKKPRFQHPKIQEKTLANILGISHVFGQDDAFSHLPPFDVSKFNQQIASHRPLTSVKDDDDFEYSDYLHSETPVNNRVVKSIQAPTPLTVVDGLDTFVAPIGATFRPPITKLPLSNAIRDDLDGGEKQGGENSAQDDNEADLFFREAPKYIPGFGEDPSKTANFEQDYYELRFGSESSDRLRPKSEPGFQQAFIIEEYPFENEFPSSDELESKSHAYDEDNSQDDYNQVEYHNSYPRSNHHPFFPEDIGTHVPDIKTHNFPSIMRHISTYSRSLDFHGSHSDEAQVADFGAASGANGAFGWYSDTPVRYRK